ncbi:MAG: hypothetical protein AB1797_11675 [bacterium]
MKRLIYHIGRLNEEEQQRLDFQDALLRKVSEHIELGFIPLKIPVIDDAPYRIFDTTQDYRQWAEKNLPKWLGYYHGKR